MPDWLWLVCHSTHCKTHLLQRFEKLASVFVLANCIHHVNPHVICSVLCWEEQEMLTLLAVWKHVYDQKDIFF